MPRRTLAVALAVLLAAPALAQSDGASGAVGAATEAASAAASGDLAGAASAATKALRGVAEERLLIADLIGAEVSGPGGASLGRIEDLVAVPGGTLVAAVLAVEGGERLPVPYRLVKVSGAADTLGVSLPVGLEALRTDESVRSLASLLDL